ncbi:MAG TPA: hypothetical protein VK815_08980 [Candidatus Acidoferrales bacterium]|nr:hypothetical protein [Candidatus Acidoferrales bacterium]
MNENQLRGWRLRQPSAGLKGRIFRTDAPASPEAALPPVRWNWHHLAPAMACMLFAMMVFHFNGLAGWQESRPATYADFTAGSNSVTFSDHAQEVENHVDGVTFDWTNHSVFKSSMRSHFGPGPTTNLSH